MEDEILRIESEIKEVKSIKEVFAQQGVRVLNNIQEFEKKIEEKIRVLNQNFESIKVLKEKIERIGKAIEENEGLKRNLKDLEIDNQIIKDKVDEFNDPGRKIDRLKKDIEIVKYSLGVIQVDKTEIIDELELIEKKMNNLSILRTEVQHKVAKKQLKLAQFQTELKECREYELEIVDKLAFHINEETDKASQLIKCKSTLAEAKSAYHKFYIRRIWMMSSTEATLSIQKDSDLLFNLQIEDSGKVQILKFDQIDSIFMHPAKQNHFFIKLSNKSTQEYFCQDAEKAVELIRELLIKNILRN